MKTLYLVTNECAEPIGVYTNRDDADRIADGSEILYVNEVELDNMENVTRILKLSIGFNIDENGNIDFESSECENGCYGQISAVTGDKTTYTSISILPDAPFNDILLYNLYIEKPLNSVPKDMKKLNEYYLKENEEYIKKFVDMHKEDERIISIMVNDERIIKISVDGTCDE